MGQKRVPTIRHGKSHVTGTQVEGAAEGRPLAARFKSNRRGVDSHPSYAALGSRSPPSHAISGVKKFQSPVGKIKSNAIGLASTSIDSKFNSEQNIPSSQPL